MSESLRINSEQMENVPEREEENDYPEFRGNPEITFGGERYKVVGFGESGVLASNTGEQFKSAQVEDAREMVMEAIATKKKEESKETGAESFDAAREAMSELLKPENIPDSAGAVGGWIEEVENLPREHGIRVEPYSHGYDTLAHRQLSKKHGGDMSPEDRKRAYSLIKENHENELSMVSTLPVTMMICAMRNKEKVSKNERMDSSKRQESIRIEEDAVDYFEGKAVEAAPDLSIDDMDKYEKGLDRRVSRLGAVARMEEEYMYGGKSPKECEKIKKSVEKYYGDIAAGFPNTHADERAKAASRELERVRSMRQAAEKSGPNDESFRMHHGEEYDKIKTLKFLYTEARRRENNVTGFGNKRRLKRDEQFALPEDFSKLAEDPDRFSVGHFRNIISECVEMEEK